jgi:ferredoxin
MSYRIVVDRELCSGFGACADIDPQTFALGDDGIVVALVGETGREEALEAARACPMAAIRALDDSGAALV